MKKLSPDWFAEGLIDFEYKQYILLAYLAEVRKHFAQEMLYPTLSDLVYHYQNLLRYKQQQEALVSRFPHTLTHIDLENLTLHYQSDIPEEPIIQEINAIVDFAIPKIKAELDAGKDIYDTVEQELCITPVGVLPLYKKEGYLLLHFANSSETSAYSYSISIFGNDERMLGIHVTYLSSYRLSLVTTFQSIKMDLIRTQKYLPNPATYLVEAPRFYPIEETILPIAKRKLLHIISM
ncbi:MAG: hypothetical protein RML72_05105 [Bacteroidia bacterium]|nr:hypothetical protein [Bacteroidia bacterium]MDW8158242.1 hypothetical protein [Bacteroidia bacterium]